jgi:hypothetical protein
MPEREVPTFNDPSLKAVLRRALAGEVAPASLRSRVEALFEDDSNLPSKGKRSHGRRSIWRHPLIGLAAAAVILVSLGTGAWIWRAERSSAQLAASPALPEFYAQDLVVRHDACCALPDHHFLKGVPDDDFRLMTQKLREKLGFPALAAAVGDGWKFDGAAAACKVGPAISAHLVFKQGSQSLSIFSVAVSSESWPAGKRPADGERFVNMQDGHPIISWVRDDTIYSVVGSNKDGPMDLRDIKPIAQDLRVALDGNDPSPQDRTTIASR